MIFLFQSMPNATHCSRGMWLEAFGYLEKENITFAPSVHQTAPSTYYYYYTNITQQI